MAFISRDDFKLAILPEELTQITRNDNTMIEQAISAAVAEMRGYLYDSYDVDVIFAKEADDRNSLLVRYAIDIAVYAIVASTQAGQDVGDRRRRYDRAIAWLSMVQKTKTYQDLPRREATIQTHITTGSQKRRNNHY